MTLNKASLFQLTLELSIKHHSKCTCVCTNVHAMDTCIIYFQ